MKENMKYIFLLGGFGNIGSFESVLKFRRGYYIYFNWQFQVISWEIDKIHNGKSSAGFPMTWLYERENFYVLNNWTLNADETNKANHEILGG